MKLPRNVGGTELARLLEKYGYHTSRQRGSHIRLTSHAQGAEHHVTIPGHDPIKIGTLSGILTDVSAYLKMSKERLIQEIFGDK